MTSAAATIRIGTRGSALAMAQAAIVERALAEHGFGCQTVTVTTAGDRRAPDTPWGEGAFVRAVEEALLGGRVDVAVHSAKDVPTEEDPRLRVGAYLAREQPLDALVLPARGPAATLDSLPPGTVIGTDSPRRRGFVLARRPDLAVVPLHGNVDTRLRRLDAGEVDALVLAAAGLERLGRADRITQLLPADIVPPAPGQGALAVQARADDPRLAEALAQIDHQPTRCAVEAERAFLRATGGGCRAPIGALAEIDGERFALLAGFATLDGRAIGLERIAGPARESAALAERLAEQIVARRAQLPGAPRVLVTRPAADARRLAARLVELGVAPLIVPAIEIELLDDADDLVSALSGLDRYDWAIVTSVNGARVVAAAGRHIAARLDRVRWAAIGASSVRELALGGAVNAWLPSQSNAATLAAELPIEAGQSVAWFRGSLADDSLAAGLRGRGALVEPITAYRTVEAPGASRPALAEAMAGEPIQAVILASPSAVNGLLTLAGATGREAILDVTAICVGPRTSTAAREAGFGRVVESATQESGALAELAAEIATAGMEVTA